MRYVLGSPDHLTDMAFSESINDLQDPSLSEAPCVPAARHDPTCMARYSCTVQHMFCTDGSAWVTVQYVFLRARPAPAVSQPPSVLPCAARLRGAWRSRPSVRSVRRPGGTDGTERRGPTRARPSDEQNEIRSMSRFAFVRPLPGRRPPGRAAGRERRSNGRHRPTGRMRTESCDPSVWSAGRVHCALESLMRSGVRRK